MNRILELDALRGIAVLAVVFFHMTMGREEAKYGFKLGVTGVDLFFIISGFVILLTLEKTKNWRSFLVSRFSRLYPAYWTCVTFTTILGLLALMLTHKPVPEGLLVKYIANMTMLQLYLRQADIDGPYWTMIVEVLFYFLMLGIYLKKKLCKVELIGCILLIITVAYHLSLYTEYLFIHNKIGNWFPLINHFPMFFSGIVFYKIKFNKPTSFRYLMIGICFLIQYNLFVDGGRSNGFITQSEYGIMISLYMIIFLLYVNSKLSFIANPMFIFLGDISYSLYLVHQALSLLIIRICDKYFHLNILIAACIFALPTALIVATVINKYIEKPAMNYIRIKYKNKIKDRS